MYAPDVEPLCTDYLAKVASLEGDALLEEMIALEQRLPPLDGERDLRAMQKLCLEAALMWTFGSGWRSVIDSRKGAV